ncbi:DUF1905 domain-containing protein [Deinococcus fonticola]|uniref:DUF1905 domain-containing protein n=1 Tax=Deinococcus fonticola TaxID=2528713 RepID=UPI001074DDB1|nr:DUF1905 domain-containing protein [Deinococcus fonticola]
MEFTAELFQWRGPAPHYFVSVPDDLKGALKAASKLVTYGWGMIPVTVGIGGAEYDTSLFPKDGGYLVPIRADVRQAEALEEGQRLTVTLDIRTGKAMRGVRRMK